ncbi:MAG: hypothetical protein U0936_13885 [Planctomycetaceae bacterium]
MRREYAFDSLSFVALSPDGHMAVLTGKLQNSGEEPEHSLLVELWLPDSNEVIPNAFDLNNLTVLEPGLQYQAVRSVQFSPDGHHLVMSVALQGAPLFKYQLLRYSNLSLNAEWNNQSSTEARHFSPVEYLGVPAHGIPNDLQVFSAGGHVAVLLEHPNRVDLWTLANGVSVKHLVKGAETPASIAFDRNAPQLCTGVISGTESATAIVEAPSLQDIKASGQ